MIPDPVPFDPHLIPPTRLEKASWESDNEGVHERVNFDDTIWGFDLAGGVKYNTPIRVTKVKDGSRAEKVHMRPGDTVLKINDIPTETMTLQDAHNIVVESGTHIRLTVTSPEDKETAYYCWQDLPEPEEPKEIILEKRKRQFLICKTNTDYNLGWPWVNTNKTIYKESNCHRVPSKFVSKFEKKLLPAHDDIPIVFPVTMHSRTYECVEEEIDGERSI